MSVMSSPAWVNSPDVEQPWYGLVEFWMMSLLHKGNAFAFKIRNQAGQVVGLREAGGVGFGVGLGH